jgi:hypothetical protein
MKAILVSQQILKESTYQILSVEQKWIHTNQPIPILKNDNIQNNKPQKKSNSMRCDS